MRIAEVIRNILDILDAIDQYDQEQEQQKSIRNVDPETSNRLNQISDLLDKQQSDIANRPNEQYADIEAVTATGNDVNKSKHPADIRTNAPSMYPGYQHNIGG